MLERTAGEMTRQLWKVPTCTSRLPPESNQDSTRGARARTPYSESSRPKCQPGAVSLALRQRGTPVDVLAAATKQGTTDPASKSGLCLKRVPWWRAMIHRVGDRHGCLTGGLHDESLS